MKVKKEVDEIAVYSGVLDREIEDSLYDVINKAVKKSKIVKELISFAKQEFFIDLSNVDHEDLESYWEQGGNSSFLEIKNKKHKKLEQRFFWSAFMFRLVKKYLKLKKFEELLFFSIQDNYFFFDGELKDYVGFIKCSKLKDKDFFQSPIKKSALCVDISAVDKAFKGMGYGKKMYLAVIEDAGCLLSDTGLYPESLNIWVNVLPKIVEYVGYIDEYGNLKKITNKNNFDRGDVKRFFATNDISFLKAPIQ